MIYWALLLIFLLSVGISKKTIKGITVSHKVIDGRGIYFYFVGLTLVLIAGLRSISVGADTAMYLKLFEYAQGFSYREGFLSWQRGGVEIGFYTLEYFFSHYLNFQLFLIVCATVSIAPVLIVIYKYSTKVWLSLFIYISFGFFAFSMNGIRQAMAMGICMIAYIMARNCKLIPFVVLVGIAVTFHQSAILFLPVYWLKNIKMNKKTPYLFFMLLITMFIIRIPAFRILSRFSRQSFNVANEQGGFRMFIFMVCIVILGWVCTNKFFSKSEEYDHNKETLILVAVSTLMWPVANLNAELNRMYYYYQIFLILYFPSFIDTVKKQKVVYYGLILLVGSYYLYSYIINGELKYNPYYFYWNN